MSEYDKLVHICEEVFKKHRYELMDNYSKQLIVRDLNISLTDHYKTGELSEIYHVGVEFREGSVIFDIPKILDKINITFERIS